MRLKETTSNWRARAIIRRDFRHDPSELAVSFKSHKDTHSWCRGKVGVKHDLAWNLESDLFGNTYKIGKCSACRKVMFRRAQTAVNYY